MKNESGIIPLEVHVIVKPEKIEEKTKGGVYIPETELNKMEMAHTEAIFVEAGANAFSNWGREPQPGDKVVIGKYAGLKSTGKDGEYYRICEDTDVRAILT